MSGGFEKFPLEIGRAGDVAPIDREVAEKKRDPPWQRC